jgi:hypothetical protein
MHPGDCEFMLTFASSRMSGNRLPRQEGLLKKL